MGHDLISRASCYGGIVSHLMKICMNDFVKFASICYAHKVQTTQVQFVVEAVTLFLPYVPVFIVMNWTHL